MLHAQASDFTVDACATASFTRMAVHSATLLVLQQRSRTEEGKPRCSQQLRFFMVCTQVCAASTFQRISSPCGSGGCRMVPKASQYSTDFRLFVRMCVQILTCTGSSGASRRGDRAVRPAATHMPMRWSRRRRRGSDRHGRSWARPTVQPLTLQYKQMCEDACLLSEAATGEWHRQLLSGMKFEGKHTSPRRDRRRSSAAPVAAPLLSPPACRQSSALAAAASLPFASGGCSGLNPAAGC